jgi:tRNA(Arg) A34 adenosine deaminase TadA
MSDKELMELALSEAVKSDEPLRCGAVIAKDGEVISSSYNTQRSDNDATAHAEVSAIRQAGKKLGSKNLEGCIVYGTCEPCKMCLSAMTFAGIEKLVYGVSLKDVSPKVIEITLEEFLEHSPRKLNVEKNFMQEECMQLYK